MKKLLLISLFMLVFCCSKDETTAEENNISDKEIFTIWIGSDFSFEKVDDSDSSDESNQDRITDNVWITRDNDGGQIYNIAKEDSADKGKSPVGTEWAIGNADQIETLKFDSFRTAVGKPQDIVGKDLIIHLLEDDIYLSIKFTSWSQGKKGGFSYVRSTP